MEFPIKLETGVTLTAAKDPVWGDRDGTFINCVVTLEGGPFEEPTDVPFTATPTDYMAHGRDLFDSFKDSAGPWVRPDVTIEDLQADFDKIWPDVMLGLADQATIDLAKNLRVQIKAMS